MAYRRRPHLATRLGRGARWSAPRRDPKLLPGAERILDTAYGKWLNEPLGRAELTVSLDDPRWLSRQRQVRSMLARLIGGRLICNGTAEPFGSFSGGIPSTSCTSRCSAATPTHPAMDD
jgi:hypothetical protein